MLAASAPLSAERALENLREDGCTIDERQLSTRIVAAADKRCAALAQNRNAFSSTDVRNLVAVGRTYCERYGRSPPVQADGGAGALEIAIDVRTPGATEAERAEVLKAAHGWGSKLALAARLPPERHRFEIELGTERRASHVRVSVQYDRDSWAEDRPTVVVDSKGGEHYRPGGRLVKVPTLHTYAAREHRVRYKLTARVIFLGRNGDAPIVASMSREEEKIDHEHDERFAPARLVPRRAQLPTPAAWVLGTLQRETADLQRSVEREFLRTSCVRDPMPVDDAARCVVAAQTTPQVQRALTGLFGADAGELTVLFPRR